jgi:hypothetical protein
VPVQPPSMADDVLFIFLDESGNFDFSPKGSKYWSLTAVCTARPVEGRETLISLLYELAAIVRKTFNFSQHVRGVRFSFSS